MRVTWVCAVCRLESRTALLRHAICLFTISFNFILIRNNPTVVGSIANTEFDCLPCHYYANAKCFNLVHISTPRMGMVAGSEPLLLCELRLCSSALHTNREWSKIFVESLWSALYRVRSECDNNNIITTRSLNNFGVWQMLLGRLVGWLIENNTRQYGFSLHYFTRINHTRTLHVRWHFLYIRQFLRLQLGVLGSTRNIVLYRSWEHQRTLFHSQCSTLISLFHRKFNFGFCKPSIYVNFLFLW